MQSVAHELHSLAKRLKGAQDVGRTSNFRVLSLCVGATAHQGSARLAFGGIFELLLENWRSSADPLPFQRNIYFDTVGEVFSCRIGKHIDTIPDEFMNASKCYSWPGNIRELQNMIERAVILSNEGLLTNPLRPTRSALVVAFPPRTTLRDSERTLILDALEATGWVVAGPYGAAARLGIKRATLIARMKKHGILRPAEEPTLDQIVNEECRAFERR